MVHLQIFDYAGQDFGVGGRPEGGLGRGDQIGLKSDPGLCGRNHRSQIGFFKKADGVGFEIGPVDADNFVRIQHELFLSSNDKQPPLLRDQIKAAVVFL